MSLNEFHDVVFPTRPKYGSVGGPGFSTNEQETFGGDTLRSANWAKELHEYNIRAMSVGQTELDEMRAFFLARKGKYAGFKYHDPTDYYGTNQLLGVGDGSRTVFYLRKIYLSSSFTFAISSVSNVSGIVEASGINAGFVEVQDLVKIDGSTGNDGYYLVTAMDTGELTLSPVPPDATADGNVLVYVQRRIKKPLAGSHRKRGNEGLSGVLVSVGGVAKTEDTDYTVDYTTGEITFVTAPTAGAEVTATQFEYFIPVQFMTDRLDVSVDAYNKFNFSLPLREVRL